MQILNLGMLHTLHDFSDKCISVIIGESTDDLYAVFNNLHPCSKLKQNNFLINPRTRKT